MDWKVVLATFGAVFFAELADKTQVVGIAMAGESRRPLSVWCGSVAAYMLVTVVSVFLGAVLGKYLKPEVVRYAGGIVFVLIGLLVILKKV